MADFDNPAFEPDEEGAFGGDTTPMSSRLPEPPVLTPPNAKQLGDFGDKIQSLRGEIRAAELNAQKQRLVDAYYKEIAETYDGLAPTKIPYDQFSIDEHGKTLYWTPDGGKKICLSVVRALSGGVAFLALSSLSGDYGPGGTHAIRQSLGLAKYTAKTARLALSANSEKAVQQAVNTLPTEFEEIELQDLTSGINDALASTEKVETVLDKELTFEQTAALASVNDPPLDTSWVSQAKRELTGLGKAMTFKRDVLINNLAKLSALNDEISALEDYVACERQKLSETNDEVLENEIRERITNLERQLSDKQLEREGWLEALSTIKEDLRSQLSRIRETMTRVLDSDKTLAEWIRTLFQEQGITIASILTAIGMAISTLVVALTRGGPIMALTGGRTTVTPPPPPPPSDKGGL